MYEHCEKQKKKKYTKLVKSRNKIKENNYVMYTIYYERCNESLDTRKDDQREKFTNTEPTYLSPTVNTENLRNVVLIRIVTLILTM